MKKNKCLNQVDNTIILDTTRTNYELSKSDRAVLDKFFNGLSGFSSSTEMVTTWLGRNPEEGGKVIIGWNQLNALVWAMLSDMKVTRKRTLWQKIKDLLSKKQ